MSRLRRKIRLQEKTTQVGSAKTRMTMADKLSDRLITKTNKWSGGQGLFNKIAGAAGLLVGAPIALTLGIVAYGNHLIEKGRKNDLASIKDEALATSSNVTDEYTDVSDIVEDVDSQLKIDSSQAISRGSTGVIDAAQTYISLDSAGLGEGFNLFQGKSGSVFNPGEKVGPFAFQAAKGGLVPKKYKHGGEVEKFKINNILSELSKR